MDEDNFPEPPPPACLLRHAQPSWMPAVRTGMFSSADVGAMSVLRFWPLLVRQRLVQMRTQRRAELLACAKRHCLGSLLLMPPFFGLELATLDALAAPVWARLESGNDAQVALCVEELSACEACHFGQLEEEAMKHARLKYFDGIGQVRFQFFQGRVRLQALPGDLGRRFPQLPPALVPVSEADHCATWALARRFAVQETMMMLGCIIQNTSERLKDLPFSEIQEFFGQTSDAFSQGISEDGVLSQMGAEGRLVHDTPWPSVFAAPPPQSGPPEPNLVCACCGAKAGGSVKLSKCAGCRLALYCSRACQQRGWKEHKGACRLEAPQATQLSFKAFASAFERAFRAIPAIRAIPDIEVSVVDEVILVQSPTTARCEIAIRNFSEKWLCTDVAEVAARVEQHASIWVETIRLTGAVDSNRPTYALDEEEPGAPFSVMTRPGSYFTETQWQAGSSRFLCPFPEILASARTLQPMGGPLAFHCLTRQRDFDAHAHTGVVQMQMCPLDGVSPERQAALFADTVQAMGTVRCPPKLTFGQHTAGGVRCDVSSLFSEHHSERGKALRVFFGDTAAAPRLACFEFVRRLGDALGCAPSRLVVVPLQIDVLLVTRADHAKGMCALGDFALFEDMTAFQRTMHLSSLPLQLAPERSPQGLCIWRPYPRFGGDVERMDQLAVPSTAAEVDRMLAAINAYAAAPRAPGGRGRRNPA